MVGVSEATDSVEGMIIEAGVLSSKDDGDGTFGRGVLGGGVGGVNCRLESATGEGVLVWGENWS